MSAVATMAAVVSGLAVSGDSLVRAVEGVAPWVWRASWQGAVLAVVVAVVLKVVGGRMSPGWRFGLWGLVLVRLAVPPVVAVSWWGERTVADVASAKPSPTLKVQPVAFEGERLGWIEERPIRVPSADRPSSSQAMGVVAVREGAHPVSLGEGGAARPEGAHSSNSMASLWGRARPLAIWAWLAGVVFLAVRVLVSSVRLSRAVRRTEVVTDPRVLGLVETCCAEMGIAGRGPVVRVLAAGGGPALVGFWRPVILLPPGVMAGMSDEELRLIVLHELAHVKRRDVLINWLATAVAVVHWANPVVWLVMERMRFERELACDEAVMRAAGRGTAVGGGGGGGDRRAYARTIVRLAEALSVGGAGVGDSGGGRVVMPAGAVGGVGIIEGKTQLQRRLQMIARFDSTGRRWPVVAMGLGMLVGAVALSGATRAAAPPAPVADKSVEKKTTAVTVAVGQPVPGEEAKPPGVPAVPGGATDPNAPAPKPGKSAAPGLPGAAAPAGGAGGAGGPAAAPGTEGAKPVRVKQQATVAKAAEADPANAKTAEKLKKPMQVQFGGQAFSDTMDFMRDVTGADILVQWNQLEAAGMSKDTPVTISLREPTPAEAVLSLMFRTLPVKLQYEIDHGVVVIGTVEDVAVAASAPEVTKVYDVSDLVGMKTEASGGAGGAGGPGFAPPGGGVGAPGVPGGYGGGAPGGPGGMVLVAGDDVTQLMRLIMTTVQPESWRDAGGTSGSITSFKGKLVIKATEAAHKEVAQLLEMLREGPAKKK